MGILETTPRVQYCAVLQRKMDSPIRAKGSVGALRLGKASSNSGSAFKQAGGYMGIMEKMETTIIGYIGFRV